VSVGPIFLSAVNYFETKFQFKWLRVNGKAIYGTRAWKKAPPVSQETTILFTRKGNDLRHVHASRKNAVTIKGIKQTTSVIMPGYDGKVTYSTKGEVKITHRTFRPDNIPCEFA
jgi:alpha-L-fucosidase